MQEHKNQTTTLCGLWLKSRPDGSPYLTGRLGHLRVIVRPADPAPTDGPTYLLEMAETDQTIRPEWTRWLRGAA